jgi:hypothetical protein
MFATTVHVLILGWAVIGQGGFREAFPAHRVIGIVYYVGSKDLASYLITTGEGHGGKNEDDEYYDLTANI